MAEGYPHNLREWGVPAILKEAGRLLSKFFSLLYPFILAFLLPSALLLFLDILGNSWIASHYPPGPHPHPHPHHFHHHHFHHRHHFGLHSFLTPSQESGETDAYPLQPTRPPVWIIAVMVLVAILLWVLMSLAVAGISKAVQYIYSNQEEEEHPGIVKSIFNSLPGALYRLFITALWVLLFTLATVAVFAVAFYLLYLLFGYPQVFGILYGLFVSIALLILGFVFFFTQEVAVLEPANYGLEALKRSAELVKAKLPTVMGYFVLTLLVAGVLDLLTDMAAIFPATGKLPHWTVYIFAALLAILYLAFWAYILVATVVLYFSSKLKYDDASLHLPEFRHSGEDNPYAPLVVPAET